MSDVNKMSVAQLEAELKKRKKREKTEKEVKRSEYERLRDEYLETTLGKMEELGGQLRAFKEDSVKLGLDLHEKMLDVFDRKKKENVDNYTLTNQAGTIRIQIERNWMCEYDETGQVAIDTIREVLREKFEPRNKGMYAIIDGILMKNNKGEYDERLVARLRKHEEAVGDPRFSEALDILARSYRPTHSRTYIRAYRRPKADGKWQEVPMNWSSM